MSILKGPSKKFYNFNITFLRFFLASFVIFVHLFPWYSFCGSYESYIINKINKFIVLVFQRAGETNPAVLAFIVLSGYCIHRNGLRNNLSKASLEEFFKRRFFRIVPLYLLAIFFGVFAFYNFSNECTHYITSTHNISFLMVVKKIFALHVWGPWNFTEYYCGNGPLVTVGTEIWLYLTYPLGLFFIKRLGEKFFLKSVVMVTATGVLCCCFFSFIRSWWHNGSLFGFLVYWWIGVFFVNPPQNILENKKKYLIFFLFLNVIYFTLTKNPFIVEIRKILLAIMMGYFLNKMDTKQALLSTKYHNFLSNFMESSYSLYALHTPLIVFFLFYGYNPFLCVAIIYLSAYLLYIIYERPLTLLGKKRKFSLATQ